MKVTAVKTIEEEQPVTLYDIGVEDNHNFFVVPQGGQPILVHNCHALTKISATPLLRAIEQSPKLTVWILVTNEPEGLLPTLVSRCYPIKVDLAPVEGLKRYLLRILRKEHALKRYSDDDKSKLVKAVIQASGQIPRVAVQILSKAVENATDFKNVKELIAGPVLGTPQVELDLAAIKIILALLLAGRGKNTLKPLLGAVVKQDAYALLKRLLFLTQSSLIERASGESQPGTYYLNKAVKERLKDEMDLADLGLLQHGFTAAVKSIGNFTMDPKAILIDTLWTLYDSLNTKDD